MFDAHLSEFLDATPRSMKRLANTVRLAVSLLPASRACPQHAFKLVLVVIMAEQWPFR